MQAITPAFSSRCPPRCVCPPLQLHSMSAVQTRMRCAPHDNVWEAALRRSEESLCHREGQGSGRIETAWLEIPMPGRTIGASQEELQDSKDRSRLILIVKPIASAFVSYDVTRVTLRRGAAALGLFNRARLFG